MWKLLRLIKNGESLVNNNAFSEHLLTNLTSNNFIRSFASAKKICWKCQKSCSYINQMFCEHCKTLREPDKSDNYFNILDLEKKYTIDRESLSQKFKGLQKLLHPDKFTNRSEKEQELSLEWSSQVNKAYATMNHPIDRAEYLLQDVGVSLSEESETKDTEFLMEMMERNEEIAEISTAKQASESLKKIQATVQELGLKLGTYIESKDYENAIKIFARMKYFYSLENNLRTKAASLTGTIES